MTAKLANLIESWLSAETAIPGRTAADALRDLNEDLDTSYTHSTLSRWRRGQQQPRPEVVAYMIEMSIGHAMNRIGAQTLTDEQYEQLTAALSPALTDNA